jgi:peptide/nickel transport system permease protein
VLSVHALAVAAAPLAALAAVVVPWLLGASLVVERAFDLRGLGALLLDAAAAGDAPVTLGATLAFGVLTALASLAADGLSQLADPRLRR